SVTVPVDFKFNAPAVLSQQVAATATVKVNGRTILIDGLDGNLDGAGFHGTASVDLESKPLVKVNLDLARLGIAKPTPNDSSIPMPAAGQSAQPEAPKPWSNQPLDLR